MKIEIAKDQDDKTLVLQLKVDDHTIQVPINLNTKIEISVLDNSCKVQENHDSPCKYFDGLQETYAKEMQQLADRGFNRPRVCLKLLSRFNGDVEKVCSVLEKRKSFEKCDESEKSIPSIPPNSGETSVPPFDTSITNPCKRSAWLEKYSKLKEVYSVQLEQLSQMGFSNTHLNIRMLKKCDGDLNQVLETLVNHSGEGHKGGWCGFGNPEKLKMLQTKYETQLAFLNRHGFYKLRKNLIALKKNDGNQDLALIWLQKGGPCKWKLLKEQYASQLQELSNRGFQNPRMNLKSLKKCNGDVDLATEWLKNRQAKHVC